MRNVRHYYVDIFIGFILLATLFIVGYFALPLFTQFDQISESSKTIFSENILQGTLTLGALALTVLAYSLSKFQYGQSTRERVPYKRISYIMFFVASFSMADATTSAAFLLTRAAYSFQLSLILLYFIVIGQTVSVGLWVRKELK